MLHTQLGGKEYILLKVSCLLICKCLLPGVYALANVTNPKKALNILLSTESILPLKLNKIPLVSQNFVRGRLKSHFYFGYFPT